MIGKALGRLANTASDLILGAANSNIVKSTVKGATRGVVNSVEPAAGIADKTIKGAQKAIGKATDKETYKAIGKAVESGAGKTTKSILTDPDSYKQVGRIPKLGLNKESAGKPILTSNKTLFADDMNRRVNTGLNTVMGIATHKSKMGNALADAIQSDNKLLNMPSKIVRGMSNGLVTGGGDNLLPFGMKATGLGVVAAGATQFAAGTPEAVKTWNSNRQGTNYDNQPVTSAPKTPAYAQNGGATGDLVFALNNLRHGGMM